VDQELSIHSEPMTSHALGGQAGSRRTLLQPCSERRADVMAHLENMTSRQKSDFVNRRTKKNPAKFHPDPI